MGPGPAIPIAHVTAIIRRGALSAGAIATLLALVAANATGQPATAPTAVPPPIGALPSRSQPAATLVPRMVPLMGKRLFTPNGDELGRVVDVVFDEMFRPFAAVVDVGGFLGVGARRVALAWSMLTLVPHDSAMRLITDTAPEKIGAAPDYKPDDPASVLSISTAR